MEVYDLRRQRLHPKEFEKIVSPAYAKSDANRHFVVVRGAANPFHSIDGLMLRNRYEYNPNAVFDPLYAQNLNKIERLIDSGEVVLIDQRQRSKANYPFFISESGELFCIDDAMYNAAFVNIIVGRFRYNVSLFGPLTPTRDSFIPSTAHYVRGIGKR